MDTNHIRGRAHVFGDNINTDLISPAQYMEKSRQEIAAHAMEGADADFVRRMKPGDIVVAGDNFGSGSSRETAPAALKDCGVSVVIARFFARIFYRNCMNIGLPALICPETGRIDEQDELEIDLMNGRVNDVTKGIELACEPLPPHMMELLKSGGLMEWLLTRKKEDEPCIRK